MATKGIEEEIKLAFSALSMERKIFVLALLAHNITIAARGVYPGQVRESETIKKLVTFNEMQHTITSQLIHRVQRSNGGHPDDTFVDTLFEKARRGGCEGELILAFKYSLSSK